MHKYLIIPPCSDFNRGDQALVWETERFARDAGFDGDYYFMAEAKEPVEQSVVHGLKPVRPILEHPSKRFKSTKNISMNYKLILKWGLVSLIDLSWSLLLLTPLRNIVTLFFSKIKKDSYNIFRDADAVFVKGGGFIHSYGGKTALYYIYFQLFHILLAQSLGKDVYIFPNSFGPFKGWGVKALVKRAFDTLKIDLNDDLKGPKAIAFGNDAVAPVKVLYDFAKKHPALVVKVGLIDGEKTEENKLSELSKLPSREGLLTMLASGLIYPLKSLSICLDLYRQDLEKKEN